MDVSKIDKGSLEVYVLYSHIFFPLNFAVHVWFVINDHGSLTRWDGGEFLVDEGLKRGVHKDVLEPFDGIRVFRGLEGWRHKGHVVKRLTEHSAEMLASFLNENARDYPYKEVYKLLGPNSNTFAQWVVDKSGVDVKLPWLAMGKGYKRM